MNTRRTVQTGLYLVFLGALIVTLYRMLSPNPRANERQTLIGQEFGTITPLPGSQMVSSYHYGSTNQGAMGASYRVTATEEEVARNYRGQLLRTGWTYAGHQTYSSYGQDFGGSSDTYCRADQQAEVDFAGKQANAGWTYGFAISWPAGSLCP